MNCPSSNGIVALMFGHILYLSHDDLILAGLYDLDNAISAARMAFAAQTKTDFIQPAKTVFRHPLRYGPIDRMVSLSGYLGGSAQLFGVKWLGSSSLNESSHNIPRATALLVLNDLETCVPVAILEASGLSAMRTTAVSCVGLSSISDYINSLAVIGTGVLGRLHAQAFLRVRPEIKKLNLYNRTKSKAEFLRDEINEIRPDVTVSIFDSAEATVAAADAIVLTTTTAEPSIKFSDVKSNAVCFDVALRGMSRDGYINSKNLFIDDYAQCLRPTLIIQKLINEKLIDENKITGTLSDLVNADKPSIRRDGLTIFHAAGMAIQDIALGASLLKRAEKMGLGLLQPLKYGKVSNEKIRLI